MPKQVQPQQSPSQQGQPSEHMGDAFTGLFSQDVPWGNEQAQKLLERGEDLLEFVIRSGISKETARRVKIWILKSGDTRYPLARRRVYFHFAQLCVATDTGIDGKRAGLFADVVKHQPRIADKGKMGGRGGMGW